MEDTTNTSTSINSTATVTGDIRIFPNPNNGTFTIIGTLGKTEDEEVVISVSDMPGQVIYKNKVMARNGNINEQVILNSSLARGMYILSVQSANENKVFHFVVE